MQYKYFIEDALKKKNEDGHVCMHLNEKCGWVANILIANTMIIELHMDNPSVIRTEWDRLTYLY